jgi:hypothetical protein
MSTIYSTTIFFHPQTLKQTKENIYEHKVEPPYLFYCSSSIVSTIWLWTNTIWVLQNGLDSQTWQMKIRILSNRSTHIYIPIYLDYDYLGEPMKNNPNISVEKMKSWLGLVDQQFEMYCIDEIPLTTKWICYHFIRLIKHWFVYRNKPNQTVFTNMQNGLETT